MRPSIIIINKKMSLSSKVFILRISDVLLESEAATERLEQTDDLDPSPSKNMICQTLLDVLSGTV